MKCRDFVSCLALSVIPLFAAGGEEKPKAPPEMATYYVGLLFRGPQWTADVTPDVQRLQQGHMANIHRMAEAGKLIVAGPFTDDGNLRGMFIFRVASPEEAKALVDADPAVKAGRLTVELHPWFAAKGIEVRPSVAVRK